MKFINIIGSQLIANIHPVALFYCYNLLFYVDIYLVLRKETGLTFSLLSGVLRLNQQTVSRSLDGAPDSVQLLPRQTYLNVDEDAAGTLERKRNYIYCLIVHIMKQEKEMHIDNLVFKVGEGFSVFHRLTWIQQKKIFILLDLNNTDFIRRLEKIKSKQTGHFQCSHSTKLKWTSISNKLLGFADSSLWSQGLVLLLSFRSWTLVRNRKHLGLQAPLVSAAARATCSPASCTSSAKAVYAATRTTRTSWSSSPRTLPRRRKDRPSSPLAGPKSGRTLPPTTGPTSGVTSDLWSSEMLLMDPQTVEWINKSTAAQMSTDLLLDHLKN